MQRVVPAVVACRFLVRMRIDRFSSDYEGTVLHKFKLDPHRQTQAIDGIRHVLHVFCCFLLAIVSMAWKNREEETLGKLSRNFQ